MTERELKEVIVLEFRGSAAFRKAEFVGCKLGLLIYQFEKGRYEQVRCLVCVLRGWVERFVGSVPILSVYGVSVDF